jgi:perosamine synthetase
MAMKAATEDVARAERTGEVIPLAQPMLDAREVQLVTEVIESGRLSLGPMLTRFEEDFARFVGTEHAVAVANGTTGLHIGAITAGWGPGHEVITSPFSFIASANVITYTGADVRFADVDPNTFNMDPVAVDAAVTERTRGILPVHIFGYTADMDPIMATAAQHGLTMVEDACEALGATYKGHTVGAMGNPAVFAFYANKQMTTGEGGMMVTDDAVLAEKWRSLVNQGRADSGMWLAHDVLGYNYRLSDVASAIGVAQLEKLPRMLAMREDVAKIYDRLLGDMPGITTPFRGDETRSWFVYVVLLDEGLDRNAIMERLNERGVQCKPYLPCLHTQPVYLERGFRKGMFPVAESISERSLALPFFPTMTLEQQERVAAELADALNAG